MVLPQIVLQRYHAIVRLHQAAGQRHDELPAAGHNGKIPGVLATVSARAHLAYG